MSRHLLLKFRICLLSFVFFSPLSAAENDPPVTAPTLPMRNVYSDLANDLAVAKYWSDKEKDRLPTLYNNILQGGYFQTPGARMGKDGTIGLGFSFVYPYWNLNLNAQTFPFLEVNAFYRIFKGVKDPVLSIHGFGDLADKGINLKFSLWNSYLDDSSFPDIAIGIDDLMGTKRFHSKYLVMSHTLKDLNLEMSLGYGKGRLQGVFGALGLTPWRHSSNEWIRGATFAGEFDPIDYKSPHKEPHPLGRSQSSKINFGLKYRLFDHWDLSVNRVRGRETAASFAVLMDAGSTKGLFPKVHDPKLYRSPVITQPLGLLRSEDSLVRDLAHAFREQGFVLNEAWIDTTKQKERVLWLNISDNKYRDEKVVHRRIEELLTALTPSNIAMVQIAISSLGIVTQQYNFKNEFLERYAKKEISHQELSLLAPMSPVKFPKEHRATLLYEKGNPIFSWKIAPEIRTFFGSARGKFKFAFGGSLFFWGDLYNQLYYNIAIGYFPFSTVHKIGNFDLLFPSQIVNVRSDSALYFRSSAFVYEAAFLQKNWNMGKKWFGRIAAGYFEAAYAGLAGEALDYPVDSCWAVGFEGALLKKRKYIGLGFQSHLRELVGTTPTFIPYTFLHQYFLDLYYDFEDIGVLTKLQIGEFLAGDKGVGATAIRYFPSGLKLYIWYTITNAHDYIHGKRYYETGVGFSVPLDLFLTESNRSRFGKAFSTWTRDAGAQALTGTPLFDLIHAEREFN